MSEVLEWARPDVWRAWIAAAPADPGSVAAHMRDRFTALRAFHGARPLDAAAYRQDGIAPFSRETWDDLVTECFLSRAADPAIAAAIAQACDVQFRLVRDGEVHFCCDERLLEERDGYTLIYGSLSLLAVAIQIDKRFGTDFKATLRRRGEPVVFVCDIPTASITDEVLIDLFDALSRAHTAAPSGAPESPFGFHFAVQGRLPPAAIVDHHRPRHVRDTVYGHHIGA